MTFNKRTRHWRGILTGGVLYIAAAFSAFAGSDENEDMEKNAAAQDPYSEAKMSAGESAVAGEDLFFEENSNDGTGQAPEANQEEESPKTITDRAYLRAALELIRKHPDSPWERIVCIGDSITEGLQSGREDKPVTWPQTMGELLSAEVENDGIGGSSIWSGGNDPMVNRVESCGEADAVFVLAGLNDWFYGVDCPEGSAEEPGTFLGDLELFYTELEEKYEDADIFIILPLEPGEYLGEAQYRPLEELIQEERAAAEAHGFYVIDLSGEGIMSAADPETAEAYFSDACHPNSRGYEILGTIITEKALQLVKE